MNLALALARSFTSQDWIQEALVPQAEEKDRAREVDQLKARAELLEVRLSPFWSLVIREPVLDVQLPTLLFVSPVHILPGRDGRAVRGHHAQGEEEAHLSGLLYSTGGSCRNSRRNGSRINNGSGKDRRKP